MTALYTDLHTELHTDQPKKKSIYLSQSLKNISIYTSDLQTDNRLTFRPSDLQAD